MSTDIEWLEQWYVAQCDGDWEHAKGVKIETLDNPGWLLTVDLAGTEREGRPDAVVRIEGDPPTAERTNVGGPAWLECRTVTRW